MEDKMVNRKGLVAFSMECKCSQIKRTIVHILKLDHNILCIDNVSIPAKYIDEFIEEAKTVDKNLAIKLGLLNSDDFEMKIKIDYAFIETYVKPYLIDDSIDGIYLNNKFHWNLICDDYNNTVLVPTRKEK